MLLLSRLAALDLRDEAAVQRFFVPQLLELLGYDVSDIRNEQRLEYKEVQTGRKKVPIARPDFLVSADGRVLFVVEAKSPKNQLEASDIDQMLSYAKHEDVRAPLSVLTNGTKTVIVETDSRVQLMKFAQSELPAQFDAVFFVLGKKMLSSEVGGLNLVEQVGSGAHGRVYKAWNWRLKRSEAVKIYSIDASQRDRARERLRQGMTAHAQLHHTNIATLYRLVEYGTELAACMQYIDGVPLDKWLEEYHPVLDERLRLFITVAQTVQFAHDHGVLHRDLKPSNIVVTKRAGVFAPVLVDLDTAVELAATAITQKSERFGTLGYMDPELLDVAVESGPSMRDARSDVYALGRILEFLVTGKPPVVSQKADITRIDSTVVPETYREQLVTIIAAATTQRRQDRTSVSVIAEQLNKLLAALEAAKPPSSPATPPPAAPLPKAEPRLAAPEAAKPPSSPATPPPTSPPPKEEPPPPDRAVLVAIGETGLHVALAMTDLLMLLQWVTPTPFPDTEIVYVDSGASTPAEELLLQEVGRRLQLLEKAPDRGRGPHLRRASFTLPTTLPDGAARAAAIAHAMLDGGPAAKHLPNVLDGIAGMHTAVCVAASTCGTIGMPLAMEISRFLARRGELSPRICSVLALPWFLPDLATDLEAMRSASTASLWQLGNMERAPHRIVLWGDPSLASSALGISNSSALLCHAAGAATAFLTGDETEDGIYSPVPDDEQIAHIREIVVTKQLTLGTLVRRNGVLRDGLTEVLRYLSEATWKLLFRRMIPEIDTLPRNRRVELKDEITKILTVKEESRARLAKIDRDLPVQPQLPIPWKRSRLRSWLQRKPFDLTSLPQLLRYVEDTQGWKLSSHRLVTLHDDDIDYMECVGTRGRIRRHRLPLSWDAVDLSRIADVHGVRDLLDGALRFRTFHEKLPSFTYGSVSVPPPLGLPDSDRVPAWFQRWFLLMAALCSGKVIAGRNDRGDLPGVPLVLDDEGKATAVGYLTPSIVCVPLGFDFWSRQSAVQELANGVSLRALERWIRALSLVGSCRYGRRLPEWLEMLTAGVDRTDFRDLEADESRDVPVAWYDETIVLPLPALRVSGTESLSQRMTRALGVAILNLQIPERNFNSNETKAWDDLNRNGMWAQLLVKRDEQCATMRKRIVWADQLAPSTLETQSEGIQYHPGARRAWSMDDALLLTLDDVLTDSIAVFGHDQTITTIPLRSRYCGLLRASEIVQRGDSFEVDLELEGRSRTVRRYDREHVEIFERATILSWPRYALRATDSAVFFASPETPFRYQVVYSDGISVSSASPLFDTGPRLQCFERPDSGYATSIPRFIAITGGNADKNIGLLLFRITLRDCDSGEEQWGIDFGTSSTVAARMANDSDEVTIVYPSRERDATSVYAIGDPVLRELLQWYPTWNRKGPADCGVWTPSQVVEIGRQPGVPSSAFRDPRFGRDFMLDHGELLDESLEARIVASPTSRQEYPERYQIHFLHHFLAQALTMELTQSRPLRRHIKMTFAVPLRHRNRCHVFVGAVNEVIHLVERDFGVEITPRFEWTSVVLSPRFLHDGFLLVADLGAGTLDLNATLYDAGKRIRQGAESGLLGPRFGLGETQFRRERDGWLRHGTAAAALRQSGLVRDYFELLGRVIALWTTAVRRRWQLTDDLPIDLRLAGLGWDLAGHGHPTDIATQLTRITRDLDLPFVFRYIDAGLPGDWRKLSLAASCAEQRGHEAGDLMESADSLDWVMGLDTIIGNQLVNARDDPRKVEVEGMARLTKEVAELLLPNVSSATLGEVARRLSSESWRDGAVNHTTRALEISPLMCLAEVAVARLLR